MATVQGPPKYHTVYVNVCTECQGETLRWENDGWTCFDCGHRNANLRTLQRKIEVETRMGSSPREHVVTLPCDYETMNNFNQFINRMEEK